MNALSANPTFRDIVRAALRHYPASKHMRRQYIGKTSLLISTERHALITGGWGPTRKQQCA